MNVHAAQDMAFRLMSDHCLLVFGWTFKWNTRKRAYGLCSYRDKTIQLSKPLTAHMTEAEVKDTILHEIAHALVGPGHGHGKVWKAMARKIGANPQATAATEAAKMVATWGMFLVNPDGSETMLRSYGRKPAQSTIAKLPMLMIRDRPETVGCIRIRRITH